MPPLTIRPLTVRRMHPWERILRCCAKRGPRGTVRCEKEALHFEGHVGYGFMEHAGRDRWGRWHFWWAR